MEESSAPLAPTLNSTRVAAHSRRSTSLRRPDSQLSFKPPLSQEKREERLRSSPFHPQPPDRELLPGLGGTPHPAWLTAAGEGRAPHTGSASCAPSLRPAAGYLPWAASRRQAAASTWPQVFARPLPGPLQARPSTAPASPPARSREASNAGPHGAARSADPSAPQAAMSRYLRPQPEHSRPPPARMPDRAVDPLSSPRRSP